jgi:hypothetical protein
VSHCLTSPSSEHVKKKNGDDSVTILLTLSLCDRKTFELVSPSLSTRTPSLKLCSPNSDGLAFVVGDEPDIEWPEYSMSKTLTSASPATVTMVWSLE